MPEVPTFLANIIEPRFARPVRVSAVIDLAPRLRLIRFQGESLRGAAFRPGQEIEIRVSNSAFRHYTPSAFDPATGSVEVIFYLHGKGPGSIWAESLRDSQPVNVLGPGGSFGLVDEAKRHVFLGDETTLGLFACLAKAAPGRCVGAIEVEWSCETWLSLSDCPLDAAPRARGDRGAALAAWLEEASIEKSPETVFYLSGHAGSIMRLRSLLTERGWPKRQIRTKAYWADGKRGL